MKVCFMMNGRVSRPASTNVKPNWSYTCGRLGKMSRVSLYPTCGETEFNTFHKPTASTCPWYKGIYMLETLEAVLILNRLQSGSSYVPMNKKHK